MPLTQEELQPILEALKQGDVKALRIAMDALNTRIDQPETTRTLYYKGERYGQYLYRTDEPDGRIIIYEEKGKSKTYPNNSTEQPPLEPYTSKSTEITKAHIEKLSDAPRKISKNKNEIFEAIFSDPKKDHRDIINAFCKEMGYNEIEITQFKKDAMVYLINVKKDPNDAQKYYIDAEIAKMHPSLENAWQNINRLIDLIGWLADNKCLTIDDKGIIQFNQNLSHHALRDLSDFLTGKNYNEIVDIKNEMRAKGGAQFFVENYQEGTQSFMKVRETSTTMQEIGAQLNYKKADSSIFTEAGRTMKEFAYSYVPGTKREGPSTAALMAEWEKLRVRPYTPLSAEPQQMVSRNRY